MSMSPATGALAVRTLSTNECDALLRRQWLGRIAFSWKDRVDVEPINYAYDPPWIFGRTEVGAKLVALAHNQWCAFEVDDAKDPYDWESVVLKGPFAALNSSMGTDDRYERALAAIRRLTPEALREGDPAPTRTILFGIHVSEISGRAMGR